MVEREFSDFETCKLRQPVKSSKPFPTKKSNNLFAYREVKKTQDKNTTAKKMLTDISM